MSRAASLGGVGGVEGGDCDIECDMGTEISPGSPSSNPPLEDHDFAPLPFHDRSDDHCVSVWVRVSV